MLLHNCILIQCIHYCLTRPAVASVLSGYKTVAEVQDALAYENATDAERDFAATIAAGPISASARTAGTVSLAWWASTSPR